MSWYRHSKYSRKSKYSYYGFSEYVPVAQRKADAAAELKKLVKKGETLQPVLLESRTIASTFWGKAWCENLESYSDFSNRLPRGRTYIRNGSVLHLEIKAGEIVAKVSGSSLYTVKIKIAPVEPKKWKDLCKECAGQIGSLLELLSGKLSASVMGVMTRKESGLFPAPSEIKLNCSCPDWADMCKHVAAVLYGVGARLDSQPDLLFKLRSVDHNDLISEAVATDVTKGATAADGTALATDDLSDVFGIEIAKPTEKTVVKPTAKKKVAPPQKAKASKAPEKVKAKQAVATKKIAKKKAATKKRVPRKAK